MLSLDAGRVVTFETLLRRVWAKPESVGANLVRNFVRNLRRELGESASSPTYLLNERGVGYRMAKPPNRRRPGATEPRRPARPEFGALAPHRDDVPLAHVESHPATPPRRQERPASTGTASCAEPAPRTVSTAAATSLWGSAGSARSRRRDGARDDQDRRSPKTLGVGPGGLPRDRNTPRIETRRISDLETLGNHEP